MSAADRLLAGRNAPPLAGLAAAEGPSSVLVGAAGGAGAAGAGVVGAGGVAVAAAGPSEVNDELRRSPWWTDAMVAAAGIPVVDVPAVSVGGGIGSFVFADYLRIAGVATSQFRILAAMDAPWSTYRHLTSSSQITANDRLRSDSSSCPDNMWGFPSYAVREAFAQRRLSKALAPLWNVLTEPVLCDYFTPAAGQVFAGLQREADRIGWWSMVDHGQVRMTRRREGGGYFTILSPRPGTSEYRQVAYRSRFVHLAVGYPGLRYLADLQDYRLRTRDHVKVVNAYEPHSHVYEVLRRQPGTVIVRGTGIVASRILNRLIDDRDRYGSDTRIVHLMRTFVDGPHGPSRFWRRPGGDGWAYQGFNWPKAGWGGQIKLRLEKLEGEERKRLFEVTGGTTTAKRKVWRRQLARGRREGWYSTLVGQVLDFQPSPEADGVIARVACGDGEVRSIGAQFIIDCTGMEPDIREHRLLADLLDYGGAGTNVLGRLDVDQHYEVRGARSGAGRMFAVGSATLGSYYTVVDSFLGLQCAALAVCDELAAEGFCHRIGSVRSVRQWWGWVRNRPLP